MTFLRLFLAGLLSLAVSTCGFAQGETTSAIVGQVTDTTGAAVAAAVVSIASRDTGMKRTASTDEAGRFDFPQLKPGSYSVKVEAEGFELQENAAVQAGLGKNRLSTSLSRLPPLNRPSR